MAHTDESNIVAEVLGVRIYRRQGEQGRASSFDASDRSKAKIDRIADMLHKRGFGVMREKLESEARDYYTLDAIWTGPGPCPENPFPSGE